MKLSNILFAAWLTMAPVFAGCGHVAKTDSPVTTKVQTGTVRAARIAKLPPLHSPDEAILHASWDAFAD